MRCFAVVLFTLLLVSGYSQNSRIVYIGESGLEVAKGEPCKYYQVLKDTFDVGDTLKSFYCHNGSIRSAVRLDSKGRYSGTLFYYRDNGGVSARITYKEGVPNGSARTWYPNGSIQSIEVYSPERPQMPVILHYWDSAGVQSITGGNGYCKCVISPFAPHPEVGEGRLISGARDSLWSFFDLKGRKLYEEQYQKGEFVSGRSFSADGEIFPYEQVETVPTYPKGIPAFYDYLVRSLKYPTEAKKNNVEGRVFVEFTIQKDGSVANVKAIRGIGSGCDEEAVRIVRGSPKWIPGKQRGQPVNQKMVLPINFALN